MDLSVSPTHGEQEMNVWNGHYHAPATIGCLCSISTEIWNGCVPRPDNVHSAAGWEDALKPVIVRYRGKVWCIYFRADAAWTRGGKSLDAAS